MFRQINWLVFLKRILIAIYVVKIVNINYSFPLKAAIKSHRYDCLQKKSNSMAEAIQVDTICKDSLLIDP